MKIIAEKLFDAVDTANSAEFSIEHLVDLGLIAKMTGTLAGTLTLQVSNDIESPTMWATLPGSIVFSGSAATLCLNFPDCGFRWVRLAWAKTSGAGTITAIINAKGA